MAEQQKTQAQTLEQVKKTAILIAGDLNYMRYFSNVKEIINACKSENEVNIAMANFEKKLYG